LTAAQRTQTQALFDAMQQQAVALGRELVEKERALDEGFAAGTIDEPSLRAQLLAIGRVQAELRHVHLATHLRQKEILTRHQIVMYDRLRGYADGHGHDGAMHQHNH
jgi:Spy/CpxP family protein refolding chaperone